MSKPLVVTWRGNVDDLKAKSAQARAEIGSVGKDAEAAGALTQKGFGQAGTVLRGLSPVLGNLGGDVAGLTSKFGSVGPALDSLAGSAGGAAVGAVAAGAGVAALAVAVGEFTLKGAQNFAALGMQVRTFQQATGTSAQEASKWVGIANTLHVPVESLTTAVGRLGVNVAAHADKLQAEGLSIARNADGTINYSQTLQNLAASYQALAGTGRDAELARDALGRGYQAMLPILTSTPERLKAITDELQKNHQLMGQDGVDSALQYQVSITQLQQAIKGLGMELGGPLLKDFTAVIVGLEVLIHKADDLGHKFSWLKEPIKLVAEAATPLLGLIAPLEQLGKNSKEFSEIQKIGADSTSAMAGALGDEGSQAAGLVDQLSAVKSAVLGLHDAQTQLAESGNRVAEAQQNLADKQQALAELSSKPIVDAQKLAEAQYAVTRAANQAADASDRLAVVQQKLGDVQNRTGDYGRELVGVQDAVQQAARRTADAEQNLADVLDRLNQVQQQSGDYARQLAEAQLSTDQAALGQAEAAQRVAEAQRSLVEAERSGDVLKVRAAQLALKEARLGVTQAALSQSDAQDQLTKLQNEAIPGTKEYDDLQRQLADAQSQVSDAQKAQSDAQDQLTRLQNEAIPGTQEYRDLQRELRDAQNQVADAANSSRTAQDQLAAAEAGDTGRATDLIKARRDVQAAEDQLRTARENQVTAIFRMQDAAQKEADAIGDSAYAAGLLSAQLDVLAGQYPALADIIGGIQSLLPTVVRHDDELIRFGRPRARGGPLEPGVPYLFGENGPEIGVFGQTGMMYPNDVLRGLAAGQGSAASGGQLVAAEVHHHYDVRVHVEGSIRDEAELGQVVHQQLLTIQQQNGTLGFHD